jgi:two-component system sensor histidine kinase DegS
MTLSVDVRRPVNPAAVSPIRFLITRRIEDLDGAMARLEAFQQEAGDRGAQLRDRVEEAERVWAQMLRGLARATPEAVDTQLRRLASTRADLAVLEERLSDTQARLADLRNEQEMLRQIHRSIDDLGASAAGPNLAMGTARLRNTTRQVFQIIEDERMRIARDMHDGPAQSMANLVLQAEILEKLLARDPQLVVDELADFKDGVRAVLDETRRLIFDLRPMMLDDLGLVPTLNGLIKDYEKRGLRVGLTVTGEAGRLPGALEPTVFRIIQEAMTNAKKHSHARSLEILVSFEPHSITAAVRDDGVGFDVGARSDGGKHLGMISMRERAELEKGRLEIRSQIGKGTEVRVSFDF